MYWFKNKKFKKNKKKFFKCENCGFEGFSNNFLKCPQCSYKTYRPFVWFRNKIEKEIEQQNENK